MYIITEYDAICVMIQRVQDFGTHPLQVTEFFEAELGKRTE